jgi:hypothetical protein
VVSVKGLMNRLSRIFPESKGLFITCLSVKMGRGRERVREKDPYNVNPSYVSDLNLVEQILDLLTIHTNTGLQRRCNV